MPPRKFYPALIICALALSSSSAKAGNSFFVVTGYANSTSVGYINGQTVSFVFTLKPGFSNNSDSFFGPTDNSWNEETVAESELWSAVSGTGLGGTYIRPTSTTWDPSSSLAAHTNGAFGVFQINVGADVTTSNTGLTTPSAQFIHRLQVNLSSGGPAFSFTGAYTEPTAYFANYNGTYAVSGLIHLVTSDSFGVSGLMDFTATSLSIIPEPSAFAMFAGATGLLSVGFFRKQRRAMAKSVPLS